MGFPQIQFRTKKPVLKKICEHIFAQRKAALNVTPHTLRSPTAWPIGTLDVVGDNYMADNTKRIVIWTYSAGDFRPMLLECQTVKHAG